MKENNFRERVIKALREHPEGLTIMDISKILGTNRITASKYIYGLISENLVDQRKIGPAKVCCLKEIK